LAPPGHTPDITDPDTCASVVQMVPCNLHVTPRNIPMSEHLGISLEHVHHIVIYVLWDWKLSSIQVPKCLNDEHKATYMGIFLERLCCCMKERETSIVKEGKS